MSSDEESEGSYESHDEESASEEEEEVVVPVKPVKRKAKGKKAKDPNKPKRNMSAFFLYSNANRSRVKEENPEVPFGQIAKILSAEYKGLPAKERAKWDKKAEKDKERYQREMANYVPPSDDSDSEGGGGGRKPKKKKKDPNAPKRNQSAFFIYSNEVRPRVREENPDASFGNIAKIISAEFKSLTPSQRARYDQLAADDKERYQREMVSYRA